MNIYDFKVKDAEGNELSLEQFKGKALLIVNLASKCGFTPQYETLEVLYEKYRKQGLMILGFPCNAFMEQEPGSNEEIQSFCKLTYGVEFPVLAKCEVNGANAEPLYVWLKEQDYPENIDVPEDFKYYDLFKKVAGDKHWGRDIPWNFTKFLFDKEGKPVGRYAPTADLEHIEAKIKEIL